MKFTRRIKRLLAIILVMVTCVVHVFPQTAYANNVKDIEIDDFIILTTLQPNTSQDWAIAYKDGIGYPGFFHNEVEKHIRKNNLNIQPKELPIPGAGRYGLDGKADIYQITRDCIYIWEVKPASNGYFPLKIGAVKQVERYVNANVLHKTGPNYVIKNNSFEVTIPSSGVTYKVTYENSLFNDGLIFYRFDRLGKKQGQEQEQPSTVTATSTVPSKEKEKAIAVLVNEEYATNPVIKVDWAKAGAFVAIAASIVAVGISSNSSSVQQALYEYSKAFLLKLGSALAEASATVGTVGFGIFATSSQVMAAEKNSENVDAKEVNDIIYEYETALEVLLGVDSYDELIDSYNGVDYGEMDELIKGIQGENEEYEEAGEAQPPRDPLIIDFKTTGIDLCSLTDGVNFDLDNNGYAEKTAWIGTEDGFLALDRNANGCIDNGGELFGDQVDIGEGRLSSSGFEALSILDDNGDKVIDEKDECYSKLLIWVDVNHNGYSEANELNSLTYYEIKEIQLNHTEGSMVDESTGTMLSESAKVVYQNASETTISEFWFPINASDTTHGDVVTAGNVPSIEQAMQNDETGELAFMVNKFVESDTIAARRYYVRKILYFITDSNDIAINSRGGNIDARELHVIEQFMGRGFNGVGGSNPNSNAAYILNNIYQDIEDYYYNILSLYGEFGGYKTLMFEYEDENGNLKLDVTCLVYFYQCLIEQGTDMETLMYDLGIYLKSYDKMHGTGYFTDYCNYYKGISEEISESVNATMNSNTYIGTSGIDCYYGSSLKDYLYGENDDDSLYGGAGNDYIMGLNGNDLLDGGVGNDVLVDDGGNDTYVFTKGYGKDIIMDNGGSNRIFFSNLTVNDILVNGTDEYDVTISIKGTNDSLVIKNFRENEAFTDYTLVFKDGTMHCMDKESPFRHIYGSNSDDVLKAVTEDSIMNAFDGNDTVIGSKGKDIIYGNDGNDSITAGEENDVIYGGEDDDLLNGEAGDDIIWGEAGCDILDGGNGNDYLYGGAGDDTYVFAENYGRDIVEDGEGVTTVKLDKSLTAEDISVYKAGDEAIISINGTKDMLIISGYAVGSENYYIEIADRKVSIDEVIMDGTKAEFDDIKLTVGTDGSDAIFADDVKNMIASGAQYDYIVAGSDDDIVFGGGDTDRILVGTGNEIIYGGEGNDQLFGEDGDDFISGGTGNDYISGGDGDDVIIAATGDDFMDDSAGNDTYYFNSGNENDSIMDNEGNNTIIFGDGISSDKIKAYRENWNDLLITFEGLPDTLTIKNYCVDEKARNFELIFADGSVFAATDKDSALRNINDKSGAEYMPSIYTDGITLTSTNGDDQLVGSEGADVLIGGDGNNRITGSNGNDSLAGGAGRDYLYGGLGSDTYIYKKGDATDTFSDSQGMNYIEISGYTVSDVKAYRTNWNDITLVLDGSGEAGLYDDSVDKIILEGFYTSEANRQYDISFNGIRYNATSGNSPLRIVYGTMNGDYMQGFDNNNITLYGGEGADTLNGTSAGDWLYGGNGDDRILGFAGKDILNGEAGNDYLEGGADNDTYIFNIGSGLDTINDNQGVNVIRLGEGLNKEGIIAYRTNWNNLTLTFPEVEDKLVIQGYFTSEDNRKFDIIFADGSKFAYTSLESPINQVYASDNDDWMNAWSDKGISLNGGAGNDNLTGGTGNDVLSGGLGNDTIAGGNGDDSYKFKAGDGFDTITDVEGLNKIIFEDVVSAEVSFSYEMSGNNTKLIIILSDTGDRIVINNYCIDNFIFQFSDGIMGRVNISDSAVSFENEPEVLE
ncbi:MAG: calcium-binding protein [Lachnospiraceae bacterium]|nr:calcium-binding protein [Lachnospiraceae bacterium]